MNIHPEARTTRRIREEIHGASKHVSNQALAKSYHVSSATIAKWRGRDEFTDRSHRPHTLQTRLSELQEWLVVEVRKTLLLPLDDLLVITREFICPEATRAGLHRTLKRHGVSHLNALLREVEDTPQSPVKRFKDYLPGFIHVDVKYLPQMPDETQRRYLFVAIDRASRWVYLDIFPDKSARSAQRFLKALIDRAPFTINKILTDNGKEFTDRFVCHGEREPTGHHLFDQTCQANDIDHRLIKPKHPQTNGMVERFNGRISRIIQSTRFASKAELEQAIQCYLRTYNYHVPQKNIGHITPIAALKAWRKKRPELFKKNVYDHPRPDR